MFLLSSNPALRKKCWRWIFYNVGVSQIKLSGPACPPRSSTYLRIQDRTECGKGTELHWGWRHCTKKVHWEGDTLQTYLIRRKIWVGITYNGGGGHSTILKECACLWLVGGSKIMQLFGTMLQAEAFQILSLAENPRWSQVWQKKDGPKMF